MAGNRRRVRRDGRTASVAMRAGDSMSWRLLVTWLEVGAVEWMLNNVT